MLRTKRATPSKSGLEEAGKREYFAASHLRHAGNKPEWFGKPFYLEEFQRTFIWNPIFGCGRLRRRPDGETAFYRRYRTALIGMPRDFGKTELICAMLLSEVAVNPINEGQYGIVAYDEVQARKILKTLSAMVRQDADLRALWEPMKGEIENRENGAVIKVFPYSPGALQSWHFNMLIADELHVWKDDAVWSAIVSGMGQVENSLLVAITTAGEERAGLLWDLLHGSEEVTCVLDDPTAYCWWWGAGEDDGIDDEKAWARLALPSWITVDNMRLMRRKLSRRNFERYVLNRWPTFKAADRAMRPSDIRACAKRSSGFDFERPFCLAIDGATSGDAFALVAHQKDDGGVDQFAEWVYAEPPEELGYYDVNQVGQLVAGICQKYRCPVGIDPARLLYWANVMQDDYGVEVYVIKQTNEIMCAASALLVNSVRSRNAALGGCPRLAEHCGNCVKLERQPYGERLSSEAHGPKSARIDAAIAAAMAMWMTAVMPKPVDFAARGGFFTLSL